MSILDEAEHEFVSAADSADDELALRDGIISRALSSDLNVIKVLIVRCIRRLPSMHECNECIGRKYNTLRGCPVCGSSLLSREDSIYCSMIYTFSKVLSCCICSSIIVGCGAGDVLAVGVRHPEGDSI